MRSLLVFVAALLIGCGGSDLNTTSAADAGGTPHDAGNGANDAGSAADAGNGALDAGAGADAGTAGCESEPACAPCAGGGVCVAGRCQQPSCGDGCLDTARGEQCDDGNTANLDGCDSRCHLEQQQRMVSMQIQFGGAGACPANAIGAAVSYAQARQQMQATIDANVLAGSINVALMLQDLVDPTGAGSQAVRVGGLSGTPYASPPLRHYDGTHDLDWWYAVDLAGLDAGRQPKQHLAGQIARGALTAGPGSLSMSLALGSAPARLDFSSVRISATLGAATPPTESSFATPGHLAAEHLDPSLSTIGSLGSGQLCGDISARSLSKLPVPAAILGAHCTQTFTAASSMLEVLVAGCTAYGIQAVITATQPDQEVPDAPPAGAGGPYKLTVGSGRTVSGCTDFRGGAAPLDACLDAAAFSTNLMFATDRVILK